MTPTAAQIEAVQAVLYDPARLNQIQDDTNSISVLLGIDNGNQAALHNWYVLSTRSLTAGKLEAAKRCHSIANTLLAMSTDIGKLSLNNADRQHLMSALQAQAASWQARGNAWGAQGKLAAPDTVAAKISGHLRSAVLEAQHVKAYLKGAP
jgi:hypothetical protein